LSSWKLAIRKAPALALQARPDSLHWLRRISARTTFGVEQISAPINQ
jgi:hypothetical protein